MYGASDEVVGTLELLFLAGIVVTVVLAEATAVPAATTSINGLGSQSREMPLHELAQPATPHMAWLAGKPLPSLGELAESCYLVADEGSKSWFICASPTGDCSVDEFYSAHYGQPGICRATRPTETVPCFFGTALALA